MGYLAGGLGSSAKASLTQVMLVSLNLTEVLVYLYGVLLGYLTLPQKRGQGWIGSISNGMEIGRAHV